MAEVTQKRRTRNLVDHRIQIGFARIIVSYLALYTVFLVLMFAVPIGYILKTFNGTESEKMEAVGRFLLGDTTFWSLLVLFIFVIAVHSVIMTQRFAGPIFVFRRYLTRLKNGELSRIHLRKKDQLQDIKNLVNEHVDQLGEHMTTIATSIESLEAIASGYSRNNVDVTELNSEITRLKELIDKGWHYSA